MTDQKPLFKSPYDIKDVSALFAIVAFVLIIAAILGNNLFGIFQENVNFGWFRSYKIFSASFNSSSIDSKISFHIWSLKKQKWSVISKSP